MRVVCARHYRVIIEYAMKNSETDYTEAKKGSQLNIVEAARRAGMSSQRFSRAVRKLKIPITRSGDKIILVETSAIEAVKGALKSGVIRRGRPKKTADEC